MNAASWIILAVVVAILSLAVRATFFKKSKGCHCAGGDDEKQSDAPCASCSQGCDGCVSASKCLTPTIRLLETDEDLKPQN